MLPLLQNKEDLLRFQRFYAAIKAIYVDGLPPHITDQANSAFCVLNETEFKEMSVQNVQAKLQTKHLLITGMNDGVLEFNAKGLATLGTLSTVTTIQGP
jgi:hypothetical protein